MGVNSWVPQELGGPNSRTGRGNFGGTCPDLTRVNIVNIVPEGAAAMQPLATSPL